jgi:hypothetical protein
LEEQGIPKFQIGPVRSSFLPKESLENAHGFFRSTLNTIERLNSIIPTLIQYYIDKQRYEAREDIANLDEAGKRELKQLNDFNERMKS